MRVQLQVYGETFPYCLVSFFQNLLQIRVNLKYEQHRFNELCWLTDNGAWPLRKMCLYGTQLISESDH